MPMSEQEIMDRAVAMDVREAVIAQKEKIWRRVIYSAYFLDEALNDFIETLSEAERKDHENDRS